MSKNEDLVSQCALRQRIDRGYREQVAFIPKELAVRGRSVVLKDPPGEWEVQAVYTTMPVSEARERSRGPRAQPRPRAPAGCLGRVIHGKLTRGHTRH